MTSTRHKLALSVTARYLFCQERQKLLTFVVVGGGPTGVEVAAELYDLVKDDLRRFYPEIWKDARVCLVELQDHVLSTYDRKISDYTSQLFSRQVTSAFSLVRTTFNMVSFCSPAPRSSFGHLKSQHRCHGVTESRTGCYTERYVCGWLQVIQNTPALNCVRRSHCDVRCACTSPMFAHSLGHTDRCYPVRHRDCHTHCLLHAKFAATATCVQPAMHVLSFLFVGL